MTTMPIDVDIDIDIVIGPGGGSPYGAVGLPDLEKVGDQPSVDLLTQRMQVHEETASMLED